MTIVLTCVAGSGLGLALLAGVYWIETRLRPAYPEWAVWQWWGEWIVGDKDDFG